MPQFETHRPVPHSADQMFDLVADVEHYPQFLPLCEALSIRSRKERDGKVLLIADMTVGYKAIRETFTTQVLLNRAERLIEVKYIDGPFSYLDNRWRFEETASGQQRPLLHRLRVQEPHPGGSHGLNVRPRLPYVLRSL